MLLSLRALCAIWALWAGWLAGPLQSKFQGILWTWTWTSGYLSSIHLCVSPSPPVTAPFLPNFFTSLSLSSATFYKVFDLVNASVKCFPHQMFRVKRLFCKNPFAPGCCCWWAPPPQATVHISHVVVDVLVTLFFGWTNWSWYWALHIG